MTRISGTSEIFIGFDGGDVISIGKSGPLTFQMETGEYVIPADAAKKYTAGLLDATASFDSQLAAGSWGCYFMREDAGPDEDGWEPRVKWDRM